MVHNFKKICIPYHRFLYNFLECFLSVTEIQLWNIFTIEAYKLHIIQQHGYSFSHKHPLAFFTWSEKTGGKWHLQDRGWSLQEIRLKWCEANRKGEFNITFHANPEPIIS